MAYENRKFLRPKEVEEVYGIKVSTLAKQRQNGFGIPFVVVGRNPKKRKGGIVLYDTEVINDRMKSKNLIRVENEK